MSNFTTIAGVLRDRQERGMADLLLTVYDAGYCAGAGVPLDPPTSLVDLLLLLEARHRAETRAARGWLSEPPLLNDEIPGWLLAQCERQNALGDAVSP